MHGCGVIDAQHCRWHHSHNLIVSNLIDLAICHIDRVSRENPVLCLCVLVYTTSALVPEPRVGIHTEGAESNILWCAHYARSICMIRKCHLWFHLAKPKFEVYPERPGSLQIVTLFCTSYISTLSSVNYEIHL
jgi:hypothetical protein